MALPRDNTSYTEYPDGGRQYTWGYVLPDGTIRPLARDFDRIKSYDEVYLNEEVKVLRSV
jgi:hypothetical protein